MCLVALPLTLKALPLLLWSFGIFPLKISKIHSPEMTIYKFMVIWTKFWPFWSLTSSLWKMRSKQSSPLNRSRVYWKFVVEKSLASKTGVHSKVNLLREPGTRRKDLSAPCWRESIRLPRPGPGSWEMLECFSQAPHFSPVPFLPSSEPVLRHLPVSGALSTALRALPWLPFVPCPLVSSVGCTDRCVVIHGALNLSIEGRTWFGLLKRKSSLFI